MSSRAVSRWNWSGAKAASSPPLRRQIEQLHSIASVGSPEPIIGPLHDNGCLVYADIATLRHAEKAIAAGVDGLVLLTAGAGGQTGWINPLAFVRAVRAMWDGPIVLAVGISDGAALLAAQAMGADLAYMGTKFIATQESMAKATYKDMLVASRIDDVKLTKAFTGLESNMLRPSIVAAGLDPDPGGVARVERPVVVEVRDVVPCMARGREAREPDDRLADGSDVVRGDGGELSPEPVECVAVEAARARLEPEDP